MVKVTRYTAEFVKEMRAKGWFRDDTVTSLWDRNAKLYPNKEAAVDSSKRLTCFQVKQLSDRIALGLLELGIRRDEVLIGQLPNSVDALLMRLACEKAGILFMQPAMTLRGEEIKYAAKSIDACAVAVTWQLGEFDYFQMMQEICPELPSLRYILVSGDEVPAGGISIKQMTEQPMEQRYPADYLDKFRFGPDELPHIQLTTGTTGMPKITEFGNHMERAMARATVERTGINGNDTIACICPMQGASGWTGFITAPLVGAKLAFLERSDAGGALKLIEREKATIVCVVPTQLIMIVRHPDFDKYDISSVRLVLQGGAPLPSAVARECEEKMGCPIVGHYGARDGGVMSMHYIDDPPEIRHATIGKPMLGTEVKILDKDGKEVPKGEIGEVTVSGSITVGGFYGDLDRTKRAWGDNFMSPFHLEDLGKFDDDGNLILVGREKDVIIRGAQNIYPAEIESIIATHPKILDVCIVPMPDPVMGEKACAYVVPKSGQEFTFDEMVSFLKEKKIAMYKLPERLEIVDSFPTLSDGQKIHTRALVEDVTNKLKAEGKIE